MPGKMYDFGEFQIFTDGFLSASFRVIQLDFCNKTAISEASFSAAARFADSDAFAVKSRIADA
jgi:hypothetical protein